MNVRLEYLLDDSSSSKTFVDILRTSFFGIETKTVSTFFSGDSEPSDNDSESEECGEVSTRGDILDILSEPGIDNSRK